MTLHEECKEFIRKSTAARTQADVEIMAFNFFRNIKGMTIMEAAKEVEGMAIGNLGKDNRVTVFSGWR